MPHKQLNPSSPVTAPGRIVGDVGVATPTESGPVADGDVIESVWTIRRAIAKGSFGTIRAIQAELAYLRRLARRRLRRAAA
jgi:hypothetical protein